MTNFNSNIIKWKFEKKNDWKKSALFIKEWWSGAHSIFENGSERVSALIFFLMSESWAKLKKLMSVEHVAKMRFGQKWPWVGLDRQNFRVQAYPKYLSKNLGPDHLFFATIARHWYHW